MKNFHTRALYHGNSATVKQGIGNASIGRCVWGKIASFLASDHGPTAVEYAVMLMLIIGVCLTGVQLLGKGVETSFTNSARSIGSALSSSSKTAPDATRSVYGTLLPDDSLACSQ
jgi:pilus assembly protein Flp/PilA